MTEDRTRMPPGYRVIGSAGSYGWVLASRHGTLHADDSPTERGIIAKAWRHHDLAKPKARA